MTAGACAPSVWSGFSRFVLLSPPSVFVCSCRFSPPGVILFPLSFFLFLSGPLAYVPEFSLSLSLIAIRVVARGLSCACCCSVPWVTLYPVSLSPSSLVARLRLFVSFVLVSRSSRSGLYLRRVVV